MERAIIKQIDSSSAGQLQNISQQTFAETFAGYNTPENMEQYLANELSLEKLKAELANPNSVFYFASIGGRTAGYLKLNFGEAQTERREENTVEIERIYVLNDFQRQGLGEQLLAKAFDVAVERGADLIWLGVWEENKKAIQFYQKHGFKTFDNHLFRLGDDEQTDILMKLQLLSSNSNETP